MLSSDVLAASRFHFWMKAFIPNEHPEVKDSFLKTRKGTWVLRAPEIPFPGTNIGNLSGTCFSTDNRGFSESPLAPARITTELMLVIDSRKVSVEKADGRDIVRIGQTENVDCVSGELLQPPLQARSETVSISDVKRQQFLSVVNVRAASANPFYKLLGLQAAPDINYEVVFQYDILSKSLTIVGVTDYFPSFEAYYRLDDGPVTKVIAWPPYKDSTAASLFEFGLGVNTRSFEEKIKVK